MGEYRKTFSMKNETSFHIVAFFATWHKLAATFLLQKKQRSFIFLNREDFNFVKAEMHNSFL